MWSILRRNPLAALLAVLMHVVIVAFLVVGVDWRKPPVPVATNVEVVQAKIVDEAKLAQQLDRLEEQQNQRQAESAALRQREAQQLADLEQRQAEEKARLAALEAERKRSEAEAAERREQAQKRAEAEEQRLAELERQRVAAEKRREVEEAERQAAAAKRRLAEEARRKTEAKKEAEAAARRQAEAKQQAEQEARRQAEAKKKAEAEARQKAELEKQRQRAERARREKMARQRELEAQLQVERDQAEVGRVVAAIKLKVERNWLRPPGTAARGLTCRVRVRLGSNGSVLLVSVIESSGNGAFDRSVESAVRKADPLPMPTSDGLKSRFRELTFEFDPVG